MHGLDSFSATYAEARDKFLAAAQDAGAALTRYDNPTLGMQGEKLSTDVAYIGPADAACVFVAISSTHGVEGFCGSGFQVDWLRARPTLPKGVAVVLVHAINTSGFSWLRRVTEEVVDLNRNFVDHSQPYPANPGYDELADAIIPPSLDEAALAAAEQKLLAYRKAHGDVAFYRAVSGGQYKHPTGLFYGGNGPTWSNRTTHAIIDRHLRGRKAVAVIDFHTGLGPFGYGELISHYDPGTKGAQWTQRIYGDSLTETKRGTSTSQARDGLGHYGYNRALAGSDVFMATLEFGTYAREQGQKVFRADHWLHRHGVVASEQGRAIKAAIRKHFYPDSDDWKEMILFRGHQVARQALAGLAGSGG
jgi:hypothetical protein